MMRQKTKHSPAFRKIKVFLLDDHILIRMGMAKIIESQPDMVVCGDAGDGITALGKMRSTLPDVLITDLCMPGMDGLDVIKHAIGAFPSLAIVALSMHDDSLYAERVLRAGAKGYVMKNEAAERMTLAIRSVMAGDTFLSERISHSLLNSLFCGRAASQKEQPLEKLSDREMQVFRMIGEGLETRKIAETLILGVKTVETHLANIKRKLNMPTLGQLRRYAANAESQFTGPRIAKVFP
jgi:DNA-binding NarL/FixJ family response regulator